MKNLILAISIFAAASIAMAEQSVTLNFSNLNLSSQENSAAQLDISKELQKQAPNTNVAGQRLKSIKLTGSSSGLGATLILLASGKAVDSQTIQSENADSVLASNVGITPGPWALAVRGQIFVQQIIVTLDTQGTTSDDFNFNNSKLVQKAIPVEQPGEFSSGQPVLYVSNDGKIFAGTVNGFYPDGSVGVVIQGRQSKVIDHSQIAIRSGCSSSREIGDFCVGDSVIAITNSGPKNATIVGIQTSGVVVLNIDGKESVANWPITAIHF